jgi:hypothetical protein
LKKVNSFGNMPSCWKSSIVFSYWSALLSIPCKLAFAWKLFAYTAPGAIAARSASIQGIPFAFQPECLQYLVMFDTWVSCICFSKIKNASNWSAQFYSITTENWEWAVNSNINFCINRESQQQSHSFTISDLLSHHCEENSGQLSLQLFSGFSQTWGLV